MTVDGRVIKTTGEHPFWIVDINEWIHASELKPGNNLLTPDGRWVSVEDVKDTGEFETVYNMRVADFSTYFVGAPSEWGFSVWAHNQYSPGVKEALEEQLAPLAAVDRKFANRIIADGEARGYPGDAWAKE